MGFISDVRTGAKAVLDAVVTANDDILLQTYRARPSSIGSVPCAWVDTARFDLEHDSGTRRWNGGEVDIFVVPGGWDNEDWADTADILTDLIVDAFTDDPHFINGNSVGEPVRVRVGSYDDGAHSYPVVVITVGRITAQEGR